MTGAPWYDWIEAVAGRRPRGHAPLSGGSIASVCRLDMPGQADLVLKQSGDHAAIALEARMLRFLRDETALPVPEVVAQADGKLLMTHIDGGGGLDAGAQRDAARHLAALHDLTASGYGFDWETTIAGIPQPNDWTRDWADFFRDRRLLHMADLCLAAGMIDGEERKRFDGLAAKLPDLIGEASAPGLIHGDMWGGNVLVADGRVTGFIDPAIYYADPEIELAFSTLFSTFDDRFFDRYGELRPIRPGFFEERRDLYNLWHLLNHVYLFGRGYWGGVAGTLTRFGC